MTIKKLVCQVGRLVQSLLAIGDLATQYFADMDVFCAGCVAEEDLHRVVAASGGTIQTSVNNIIDEVLGTCEVFEEKQVGNEKFNIFSGCPSGRTATIVLRGEVDQNDFIKYGQEEEATDDQEETGWKYIHGDVFRFPK